LRVNRIGELIHPASESMVIGGDAVVVGDAAVNAVVPSADNR